MPDPVVPPLPPSGTDGFAPPERQPWQLPVAKELVTRSGIPDGALLCVLCDDVSMEDHRRCLTRIALWRLRSATVAAGAFVLLISGSVAVGDGFGLFLAEIVAYLLLFSILSLAVVYLMLLGGVGRQIRSRSGAGRIASLALIADRSLLYHVAGDATKQIAWSGVSYIRVIGGDLFFFGKWDNASGGWLYMPRRAFANEEDARLLADALRNLAKANGDPAALSADARVTFPPQ